MIFNKRPQTHLRNKTLSVLPYQCYFSDLGRRESGITALGALYEGSYFRYRSSVNEIRETTIVPTTQQVHK